MMTTLQDVVTTLKGALSFNDATFEAEADAPDGVRRGLTFLVVLALAVGFVVSLAGFVQTVATNPADEVDQAMTQVGTVFDQLKQMGVLGDEAAAQMTLDNIQAGMAMGKHIAEVVAASTPAPQPMVRLFEALGKWLSWPFSWISLWLLWGVVTLLFARLLGGTATIQRMLAVTALVAAPHVLDAFSWVPCVGALIGLLAWLWGIVIYVKATAVANRINPGAALLAVILPVLIPIFLVLSFVFLAVLLNSGGR